MNLIISIYKIDSDAGMGHDWDTQLRLGRVLGLIIYPNLGLGHETSF